MIRQPHHNNFFLKNNSIVEGSEDLNQKNVQWLVNNYEDDVWKLQPHIHTDDNSKYTVNWDIYDTSEYVGVFNRWDYWKSAAKELAYWIMEAPTNKCNTTSSLVNYCRSIRELYEWLCFERKCFSLSEVKQDDLTSFIEHISMRNLTESTVLNKLIIISYVYSHRKYLSESFSFNPFKTKKIKSLAKAHSVVNGHTPTLYPQEIFSLLNHALKLVKESAPTLELFNKYMEIHADTSRCPRSIYSRFFKLTGVSSSGLQKKVRAL